MHDRGGGVRLLLQIEAIRIGLMFGSIFFVLGVVTPYLPVWLKARGFSVAEIGILSALPQLVRIIVAPAIGFDADRRNAHRQNTIRLAALAVVAWAMLAVTESFAAALVATSLVAISNCLGSLVETIAMASVRAKGHDYGRMRLIGTGMFVAANLVGGWLLAGAGAEIIIGLILCGAVAMLVTAMALPQPEHASEARRPLTLTDARALLAMPKLLAILLASGAVQGAHGMFYAYGTLHWQSLGIDARWFGALWALGLVTELALFWWSKRFLARLGALGVFLFGALASVLRWTALGFDPKLPVLIPLQLLHGITFGASHLGAMHAIAAYAPADRAATAQALHSVVTGLCIVLATTFAARAYPALGGAAYFGMATMALAGLLIALRLVRSNDQKL